MMNETEAIAILVACKPLAERLSAVVSTGSAPLKYDLTKDDLVVIQGFERLQNDPLTAGPGLFNRLVKQAGLNQVEVYKLEQLTRILAKRRLRG